MNTQSQQPKSLINIDTNPPPTESRFDTSCAGCVFEKDVNGNKITCDMGVIQCFKAQNINIILDKNGSYRVIGRICPYYRGKLWQEIYKENIVGQARKEAELRYDLIILVSTLTNLENCLNHICRLSIKPKNLLIVSENHSLINLGKVINNSDIVTKNYNINWRTEKLLKNELEWSPITIVDYMAEKCVSTYFSVINDNESIGYSHYNSLDNLLNDEMLPILVCKSQKGLHGSIYSRHAWNITKNITGLEQWCRDEHPNKIVDIDIWTTK